MTEIIESSGIKLTLEGIQFAEQTTQEQWWELHRQILISKKASGLWLRQSREWASTRYGDDYVGQSEAQMELSLGLAKPQKPQDTLNPGDKSKAITNIQGISTSFQLWYRKMDDKIEQWDKPTLFQALDLISPMEQAAKRIRERINSLS